MSRMILALDCSWQSLTLCLFTGNQFIAEVVEPPLPHQSSQLIKKIDELLKKSGHALSEITDVLYAYGPGSFTSLRIGLTTLQGLFLNSSTRLHVISSLLLRCLSVQNDDAQNATAFMKAGQARFYVGILQEGEFSEKLADGHDMPTSDFVNASAFRKIWREKKYHSVSWTEVRLNYKQNAVPNLGA